MHAVCVCAFSLSLSVHVWVRVCACVRACAGSAAVASIREGALSMRCSTTAPPDASLTRRIHLRRRTREWRVHVEDQPSGAAAQLVAYCQPCESAACSKPIRQPDSHRARGLGGAASERERCQMPPARTGLQAPLAARNRRRSRMEAQAIQGSRLRDWFTRTPHIEPATPPLLANPHAARRGYRVHAARRARTAIAAAVTHASTGAAAAATSAQQSTASAATAAAPTAVGTPTSRADRGAIRCRRRCGSRQPYHLLDEDKLRGGRRGRIEGARREQ